MKLIFGSAVVSQDDDVVGSLERAVINLGTTEVKHYVIHKKRWPVRDILVPANAVEELDDELAVRMTTRELEKMPDFPGTRLGASRAGIQPPPSTTTSPRPPETPSRRQPGPVWPAPDTAELGNDTRVLCVDGEIGTVKGIFVDDMTEEVTEVIVQSNRLPTDAVVPAAWVGHFKPGRIELECSMDEIARYVS